MIPAAGAPGTAGRDFRVAREAADDVAGRLAARLPSSLVAAVLPVVEQIAEERVAEALGEAIGIGSTRSPLDAVAWMARRHAAALRTAR